jgi:hypothetical protein
VTHLLQARSTLFLSLADEVQSSRSTTRIHTFTSFYFALLLERDFFFTTLIV